MSDTAVETDWDLLARYTRDHAEEAFAELVRRHLGLVHSAALRQVRSPQLAEEVAQSAFTDLARNAPRLAPDTILTAWLYQVTRRTAIDVVRREARRQRREQIATEMNAMNTTTADWAHIEPLLDEAMSALDDTDRAAVLLRYFENKSLREVGAALGTSDDAAQKRVSRAVERLREFFIQRGITVGAGGLAVVISANAVQTTPVGLAATISTAATLAGTAFATATTTTTLQTIAMTTLQKVLVTTALTAAVGVALYEARQVAQLRAENKILLQQQASLAGQAGQIEKLQRDHDNAKKRIAALAEELATAQKSPSEVQKLRGQVGVLRQEKAAIGNTSAISKITADPETRKMMREQQKMGMSMIFTDLAKNLKLTPEAKGQFNDLMADSVMDGIDVITQALHDKASGQEIDKLFHAQEAALQEKLGALLGAEGLAQYQQFSKELLGTISAAQFESNLTGDKEVKAEKKRQFLQALKEEARAGLAALGLPADYQAVPMLNFRNIASEEIATRNLKLLDDIYARVTTRAGTFLTEEELKKLQEFRTKAQENSQMGLVMNRRLMAPIAP